MTDQFIDIATYLWVRSLTDIGISQATYTNTSTINPLSEPIYQNLFIRTDFPRSQMWFFLWFLYSDISKYLLCEQDFSGHKGFG